MFSFFKKKTPQPVAASETLNAPGDAALGGSTAGLIGSALVTPITAQNPAPAQGLLAGREPWLNKLKAVSYRFKAWLIALPYGLSQR